MSSSVSKARDARDGRVSQRQHAIDTAVDTAKDAAVEGLALHPAAAIFRNEALAGVGDENAVLEVENSRFRHLRDISQKLDITFSTASSESRPGTNAIFVNYHESMRVRTLLGNGIVALIDGNEELVIPINDASAHPIDDCGTFGNISGNLAGMTIGSFPGGPFFYSVPKVRVEDDGSVQLTLHLSPLICIEGRLQAHMSNDALAAYVERGNFMACMSSPVPLPLINNREPPSQTNGITFTPTLISMSLTPHLKKTLTFVSEVISSAPSGFNEDLVDNMRRLVVEALGESEHKDVLSKNLELKCESAALAGIRNLMLGIDVSHSAGAFSVTLDEGEKLTGNPMWRIALDGRENMPLPVSDMGSIGLSFSGSRLNMMLAETLFHVGRGAQPLVFRLGICPRVHFILFGIFNWDDFTEDEISEIAEDLRTKLESVLEGNGDDLFPSTMTFRIISIFCELSFADDKLKMVGLMKQPVTDE
eukprot:scaffold821_cov123-Skeletonema_dohrnii-CCMP3373.AAC.6